MAGYTKTNNSDRITTLVDNLNTVSQDVGNLTELNTLVDSDLTSAINELHDSIDGITSRLDSLDDFIGVTIPLATDADTVVGAINELHDSMGTVTLRTSVDSIKGAINEHETDIGNMTLTGYTATDISAALREVMTELGNVETLSTAATTAVTAINEHELDIGNMTFTGLTATNISAALRELRTELGDHTQLVTLATNAIAAINELHDSLGTVTLSTSVDNIKGAINELHDSLGTVALSTSVDSIKGAINEVDANVDSNYTRLTTAETNITTLDDRADSIDTLINVGTALHTTSTTIIGAINEINDDLHGLTDDSAGSLLTLADTLVGGINELHDSIGTVTLTTTAKNLKSAINELDSDIGARPHTNLVTTAKTLTGAINEVDANVDSNYTRLTTAESDIVTLDSRVDSIDLRYGATSKLSDSIGSGLNLTTAINEVYSFAVQIDADQSTVNTRVGSLNNLNTADKTSTVNAINELHDSIDAFINHGEASLTNLTVADSIDASYIYADSNLIIPVGTTNERSGNPTQGEIRYNTTDASFEGYSGSHWGSLGGVKDVDGDTFIQTEVRAGEDSDTLKFYTTDNLALTLTNDSAIFTGNIAAQDASFAKITGDSATFTNLTVSGTTTYVNTETLTIDDNLIELNANASAPNENAGIVIRRGPNNLNVSLQYIETFNRWVATDSNNPSPTDSVKLLREKDLVGGNHISITNSTFNHDAPAAEDTARSSNNSGRTYIQDISVDSFGHIRSISTATETYSYSLPKATNTIRGGIELFNSTVNTEAANTVTTTSGRTYGLQLNSNDQGVVNVPWTDTDTWKANSVNVEGYVSAPGVVSGKVWKTDGSGNPAWRDEVDNYVGTVTTVTLSEGEGMTISGGPITTNQEVTITLDLTDLPIDGTEYDPTQDQIVYINNGDQKKKSFGTFNVKNSSGTVVAKLLRAD